MIARLYSNEDSSMTTFDDFGQFSNYKNAETN